MKLNLIKNKDVILHRDNVISIDIDEEGFRVEYLNETQYISQYIEVDFDLLVLRR